TGATGDPHLIGFSGQHFDFTGESGGWYNLVSDGEVTINMRVTAPLPGLPIVTYITGVGIRTPDLEGNIHTIEIMVKDTDSMESSCSSDEISCLADGAVTVHLNSVEVTAPGKYPVGMGVHVSAANLPGECRPFGFERYWQSKILEAALKTESRASSRRVQFVMDMDEWILSDVAKTNPVECKVYVENAVQEGTLFDHQSEHVLFQIVTPTLTLRLNHGKLHQVAMPDPSGRFDLPDHLTYQMNLGFVHADFGLLPKGILGETTVANVGEDGTPILEGMGAIRGTEEAYRVQGVLETDFKQLHAFHS
ncbi:unnamed protein product, partial [Choristocarpus tenellus]